MDKVLLIDGHNAIWRANVSFGPPIKHEPIGPLGISDGMTDCVCKAPWDLEGDFCYGQRYSVVFNFFRNLRPLIEEFSPDKCFFILEGHPQFRYDLYADYKANRIIKKASRAEAQDKMMEAREVILLLLPHLPITLVRAAKYEADDVVATLCENLKTEDLTIISTDTDYIQLLQRNYTQIQIYNPVKKNYMEAPSYPYVAWKCLNGDKSDNIPAILKPKSALTTITDPVLFKKFLEVEENRANFNINRQLIEFHPVPPDEIEWQEGQRNFQFLYDAFKQMKFESIIKSQTWDRYVNTFNCLKY
jgi:5'-3' exonuclease